MNATRRAIRSEPARPRLALSVQHEAGSGDCPADRAQLRRWALAALEHDAALTLRFVGAREGRALNAQFRGRDYATNVLTFTYDAQGDPPADSGDGPVQADIVICLPVLVREARAQKKSLREHLAHLVIHGVLHAQGMDHEDEDEAREMEARETALLGRFRIADPYR
jgi:probable rRNA maturation factor